MQLTPSLRIGRRNEIRESQMQLLPFGAGVDLAAIGAQINNVMPPIFRIVSYTGQFRRFRFRILPRHCAARCESSGAGAVAGIAADNGGGDGANAGAGAAITGGAATERCRRVAAGATCVAASTTGAAPRAAGARGAPSRVYNNSVNEFTTVAANATGTAQRVPR